MQFILTVTARGIVTLPASLRKKLGIRPDDQLIAETTDQGVLLRPAVTLPIEIYTSERVAEFDAEEAELGKVLRKKSID